MLLHLGDFRAAEGLTGHTQETTHRWLETADAEAIPQVLVRDLPLSPMEGDEFWPSCPGEGACPP